MSYRRPSAYPYPNQFKSIDDATAYAKQMYAALLENDSRAEWISSDLGNFIDGGPFLETPLVLIDGGRF